MYTVGYHLTGGGVRVGGVEGKGMKSSMNGKGRLKCWVVQMPLTMYIYFEQKELEGSTLVLYTDEVLAVNN